MGTHSFHCASSSFPEVRKVSATAFQFVSAGSEARKFRDSWRCVKISICFSNARHARESGGPLALEVTSSSDSPWK